MASSRPRPATVEGGAFGNWANLLLTSADNAPPSKPWEQAGTSSGPAPFKPPSSGSTSEVVEASGTRPGEVVTGPERNARFNRNVPARPLAPRPWQQDYGTSYGGYGSNLNYNSGYGSVTYGSFSGIGRSYSGGLYGNRMFTGYGGFNGGSLHNNGYGGPLGGHAMGMGGPFAHQNPNNSDGPPSPPGFWISLIRVMHSIVDFFGRVSLLMDQNTHAFHMFMTALLQIFDRSGLLYGEIARFVMGILGIRRWRKKRQQLGSGTDGDGQKYIEGPKAPGSWETVWGDDAKAVESETQT